AQTMRSELAVSFPQREPSVGQVNVVDTIAVGVEQLILSGVAHEPRDPDQDLLDRLPVEPPDEREVLGARFAALLAPFADPARLEALRVHARDRIHLVLELIRDPTEQPCSDLAPRARQNQQL